MGSRGELKKGSYTKIIFASCECLIFKYLRDQLPVHARCEGWRCLRSPLRLSWHLALKVKHW